MRRLAAMLVHAFTATGALWAFLAILAVLDERFDLAFLWLAVAVAVDSVDGTMARAAKVKTHAADFDGRKLDDIADYLNFTFVPVLILWQGQWLPQPAWLFAGVPLVASLMAFANEGIKEDDEGFFVGFPSYWNIVAFYVAIWLRHYGTAVVGGLVLFLSVLSLMPVRFLYPTRARRFRKTLCVGGAAWMGLGLAMLWHYPDPPMWMIGLSLCYVALYLGLSWITSPGRSSSSPALPSSSH